MKKTLPLKGGAGDPSGVPSPSRTRSALRAALAAPALLAAGLGLVPDAGAQQALLASELAGGSHTILAFDETDMSGVVAQESATFLALRLAGFAERDRLRRDVPVLVGRDGPAPAVRLPEQGSLYLADTPDTTRLLRVDPTGRVSTLYDARRSGGPSQLSPWIAVSRGGDRVLVATRPTVGGDVHLLDVEANGAPVDLTPDMDALEVTPESLRLGDGDAWFLAGGELYHSDLATPALPATLPLTVQLHADDGTSHECWEASYTEAKKNDDTRLVARGP